MKVCTRCSVAKSLDEYHRDKSVKIGRKSYCKECAKIYLKAWRDVNKEKVNKINKNWREKSNYNQGDYSRKRLYGITPEQYNEMLESQNGSCAVCHRPSSDFKKSLAVDHDHTTGEIFGLLCWKCNQKIIGDTRDPLIFERAASFLRQGTGWFVPDNKKKPKKRRRKKKNG